MNHGERHAQYIALIPAYLSHQLTAPKAVEAELHFQQCEECAAELHYAAQLHEHFQQRRKIVKLWDDTAQDVELNWLNPTREQKNFDQLWSRIEYNAARTATTSRHRWFAIAAAAALLAIALPLSKTAWYQTATTPEYKTLADSNTRVACGQLRVRFVDNFAAADMQSLLQSVDAHIVDGPTPHGVYTLRTRESATTALHTLRLHPAVALVEPTDC